MTDRCTGCGKPDRVIVECVNPKGWFCASCLDARGVVFATQAPNDPNIYPKPIDHPVLRKPWSVPTIVSGIPFVMTIHFEHGTELVEGSLPFERLTFVKPKIVGRHRKHPNIDGKMED